MIRSLHIRNFKCFEDQPFELGNLTLLSGLNGTGKSSVLQALVMLRQSYQQRFLQNAEFLLNGDLIKLGKAKDVFYEGATSKEFGFCLDFSDQPPANWNFEYDQKADVVRLASVPAPDSVYKTSLFGDDFHYLTAERVGPRTTFEASDYFVREHRQLGIRGEYTSHFLDTFGGSRIISKALVHPKTKGEETETTDLITQVEAWMGDISPSVQIKLTSYPEIDLISLQYVFVDGDVPTNRYRSTNVGFGITYTLPILVALLSSRQDALVLLENPEAHLHPRGQFQLGELMARAASCGIQIVVESHSDHVLNGIRIAVRQGILAPEQLRLYYLERNPKIDQISSQVISPCVDKNGRIDQWPDGFFDEWEKSLEQLF
jgi:predicted ATPase